MKIVLTVIILMLAGGEAGIALVRHEGQRRSTAPVQTAATITLVPQLITAASPQLLPAGVSAEAIDTASGAVLYRQNSSAQRPIASITKIMTTYIVLSHHRLNDEVKIHDLPSYEAEDETLGLNTGDTLTVGELAQAALISSDNDAADALAIYDAGSQQAFVAKMNQTLAEWGITGAHFASTSGLDDDNNYANASALAQIAQLALTSSTLKSLVATPNATITNAAGTVYMLKATNDLLADGQFYGIKTGYTAAAGQCFVGLTTIKGHEVMTVVLGSADRFGDTLALKNWIEGAWTWQ